MWVPLFREDAVLANRFEREARSWLGTPYRHLAREKGIFGGADCTLFIGEVLVAVGLIPCLKYEHYSKDWYKNSNDEMILNYFFQHMESLLPGVTAIMEPPSEVVEEFGDILTFAMFSNRVTNHASIYLGNKKMIQSIPRKGVVESWFGPWWSKRQTNIIRFMKEI